jgi:hypothetical protein
VLKGIHGNRFGGLFARPHSTRLFPYLLHVFGGVLLTISCYRRRCRTGLHPRPGVDRPHKMALPGNSMAAGEAMFVTSLSSYYLKFLQLNTVGISPQPISLRSRR